MSKKRINKIKKTIHNLKLAIQKVMIWDEVKEYVRDELKAGEIVDITNIDTRKYYTCPEGFPSEYCSKENAERDFYVVTSTGATFIIKECVFGLNYESEPDSTEFYIFDANKNLIYPPESGQTRKLLSDYYKEN